MFLEVFMMLYHILFEDINSKYYNEDINSKYYDEDILTHE